MNITKDEARILSIMIEDAKYNLSEKIDKVIGCSGMDALNALENKLFRYSEDKRRNGRTSQNGFGDLARRFIKNK